MKSDLRDMATYTGAQIRARKYSALAGHRGDGGNMDGRTFQPPLDPMSMKSAAPVSSMGRLDSAQFALPNPNFPLESPRQMPQLGYPANQIVGSPALSDVSTIPWLSRMSSLSRQDAMSTDSRCHSSTSEAQEGKGTGHFLKDSAGQRKFSSEESHRAKGDFPLRPIPQLVPSDYIASLSRKGVYLDNSRPPSTATSLRSTVLDFGSRNSSSFSSPRHSARGRKRGLSISPLSADLIDLNAIIRTSPNSLVAFITASRGSSSASRASGSYGHLSAASNNISPSPAPAAHALLGRQRHPFATPMLPRSAGLTGPKIKEEDDVSNTESEISSTLSVDDAGTVADRKRLEEGGKVHFQEVEGMQMTGDVTPKAADESDEEDEKEVVECRCRWKKCFKLFETQDELVQHVNGDHIQKNKKDYTCYWDDCSREQKPFKAMYMLVVHVRRHTGEKPHKCNFRDCTKAYSRLENLKTHLRSHTGERPYVCEFEGCNKAFSNASDRAKHQNRTHSSVKQYGCKIPGCPKRYTDPSSLRKHMKTVHGTLPQPNKKMKGDRSESKDKHNSSDKNRSEAERRKSVGECLTVKPLQKNSDSHGKGTGASGAGGQAYHMSGGHHLSPGTGGEGFGNTYRAWGVQQASPTSTTNDPNSFEQWAGDGNPSCSEQGAEGNGPLMQLTPRPPVLPRISGKPRAYEGLLHEVSRRLSEDRGRRSSNASLLSVDSSYQSGNESGGPSHAGSRRGSDIGSVHSYLSSRRSSAASPLPSSRLSPGSIAKQTVLEGKVLEPSDNKAGLISYPIEGASATDPALPEGMTSSIDFAHNPHNRHSRVSSGYGSQNNYFKCQSPAFQRVMSPFPLPSGQRRASDGNVRRLSDQGFNPLLQRLGLQNRRGSEPVVPVREHIELNDRRQSLNIYDPLPLPPSMHKFSMDENGADLVPCTRTRSSGTNQAAISVAPSAQDRFLRPNLCVQHQNDFSDLQLPPSEEELASGSNFMPAMPAESLIQAADSTVPDHTEFPNMGIPVVTSGSFRTPPGNYHTSSGVDFNASISWSGAPKDAGKHSEVMEADSTMDHTSISATQPRSYEEIMVNDLRALSTSTCPNQTSMYGGGSNMAINDMNTLLNSLAVENRYYETSNYDNTHFI